MQTQARYRIGIDTGGAFTDVVAVEERAGRVFTAEVPSTPRAIVPAQRVRRDA